MSDENRQPDQESVANRSADPIEPQSFSREYVTELRQENARYRTRAQELEQQVTSRQETHDRYVRRIAELEETQTTLLAQQQEERVSRAIEQAAHTAAIPSKILKRMVDPAEIEYDQHGNPTNLDKLVEAIVAEFPSLTSLTMKPQQQSRQPVITVAKPNTTTQSIDLAKFADDAYRRAHPEEFAAAIRAGSTRK
jgi:hypothetical protein